MKHKIPMLWPDGLKKALTFSYDDGVTQDIRLISLFRMYGVKATFNLNSGSFGQIDKGTWNGMEYDHSHVSDDDIADTYAGFECAVHTEGHPDLTQLSPECVAGEILNDRAAIENFVGYPVRGMAYPYGTVNDKVKEIVKSCGISYSRGTEVTGRFDLPTDRYDWACSCHHTGLEPLIDKFLAESRWAKLLSVWGHSYEFDQRNNWDVFEAQLERLGGNDDVWYATNIQVFDYIDAYRQLHWTVDGTRAQNPTAVDIFVEVDGETICVPAGGAVEV